MIHLLDNKIEDATIVANGGNSNFPEEFLYSETLQNGTLYTDYIDIDLGSALAIDTLAVAGSTTTVTIKANSSESWASPPVEITMTPISGNINIPEVALRLKLTAENWTYRYWRVEATGQNYLAHLFIGNKFTFPNTDIGSLPSYPSTDRFSQTQNGAGLRENGTVLREQTFGFTLASKTDYDTMTTQYYNNRLKPGLFFQLEDSPAHFDPYYARVTEFRSDQYVGPYRNMDLGININEVK
jgi:hypothetical protein